MCECSRLSRGALSDLRMIIDSVVRTLADDGGDDDARPVDDTTNAAVRPRRTQSPVGWRSQEGTAGSPGSTDPGGGHEQDHRRPVCVIGNRPHTPAFRATGAEPYWRPEFKITLDAIYNLEVGFILSGDAMRLSRSGAGLLCRSSSPVIKRPIGWGTPQTTETKVLALVRGPVDACMRMSQ